MTTKPTRKSASTAAPATAASTQSAKPKRPPSEVYVSINRRERDALSLVGLRERALYMELKWLANFKTGHVGRFQKQKLTWAQVAALINVPGVQGRGQGNMDDTQAADCVNRLMQAGLVCDVGRRDDNNGLCFKLPMSPIRLKGAEPANADASYTVIEADFRGNTGEVSGEIGIIFPDGGPSKMPENPMTTGVCEQVPPPLSVLDQYDINTFSVNAARSGPSGARAAVGSGTGAAAPSEKSPVETLFKSAQSLAAMRRRPKAAALPPEAQALRDQLERSELFFSYLDTDESRGLYQSWATKGVKATDIGYALQRIAANPNILASPRGVQEQLDAMMRGRCSFGGLRGAVAL